MGIGGSQRAEGKILGFAGSIGPSPDGEGSEGTVGYHRHLGPAGYYGDSDGAPGA